MRSWLEPLYDADQMRATDAWAIEQLGVPSLELMEAAGAAVAHAARRVARPGPVKVVCGKGNNGGDGLVAARHLERDRGREVEALLLWPAEQLSADARANYERCRAVRRVDADELPAELAGAGVVIDAIFGTGFSGAPRAPADAAIEAINASACPVVAADIPSGVDAATGEVSGTAVRADVTIAFHAAKLGHWVAPGKWGVGELVVAPIGIPDGAPVALDAGLIGPGVLDLLPARSAESTKFSSGSVVVVGGSRGLTGAVCMAALAAIRSGAGYATVAVPASLEPIFEVKLTEVMSTALPDADGHLIAAAAEAAAAACERADAVLLGPGLGRDDDAAELVRELASRLEKPLVVDADGLNAFSGRLELLAQRGAATLLTPHAGELGRLLGTGSDAVTASRLAAARDGATRSRSVVVLKGDDTLVTDGDLVAVNGVDAPGLATAGTGDVLAGLLAALIAGGLEPFEAASAAVLGHARAGRRAAERVGAESVIATDVIDSLHAGLGRGAIDRG